MIETYPPDKLQELGYARVAALKNVVRVADVPANIDSMLDVAASAHTDGVDVAVYPELCVTGYTCGDLFKDQTLLSAAEDGLAEFAARSAEFAETAFVIGLPFAVDNSLYNCAAVVKVGAILGIVPKTKIPNYNEFYEARHFADGSNLDRVVTIAGQEVPVSTQQIFDIGSAKVGVEICEDLWQSGAPNDRLAQSGANVIVNLSASNEVIGKSGYRRNLVTATAGKLACAYVYSSAGVEESTADLVMGGSAIISVNGSVAAEGRRFARGNTLVAADVDITHLMHDRRTMNTTVNAEQPYAVRKAAVTEWMAQRELLRTPSAHPFVPSSTHERDERAQEIIEIQAQGLATRLLSLPESHRKVVLGLSGGLDSTLALIVAIHACDILGMDYKNIHTITMPGFGSSNETQSDADVMAAAFGTTHSHIPIVDIATQELTMLDHPLDRHDITFENVQARARTNLLFNYSNQVGGMVLGTGDLSELALGWCTFNADHMSQYNVNTSIPKTLVKHLVQWASEQDFVTSVGADEPINAILGRRFSPELIPAIDGKIQDTEDCIGDYELHDFFIYYFNRFGDQPKKIIYLAEKAFDGIFDKRQILETLDMFFTRWFNNQWKRNVLPDGPKVGTVSYSPRGDLRMPPEASMRLWQDQIRAELASLDK